jgi:RecA/RadA recombinase
MSNFIKELLGDVDKRFKSKFKDSYTEFRLAVDEPPATGMTVDNPLLEYILDRRFLAYGRFYLAYGAKGASKTSLFFDLAKMFQRNGGEVIWLETEHAADIDYAAKQGLDLERLAIVHPKSLEEALNIAEGIIRELPRKDPDGKTPLLICLDSIAGSVTEYEQDQANDMTDTTPGAHARLLSRFYREMEGPMANERCVFLALNQLREKIGSFGFSPDAKDTMIGGMAPLFHSTYQFKMAYTGTIKGKDKSGAERKHGSTHSITCKRNKLGREGNMQKIDVDLYINGGMDWWGPLIRMVGKNYTSIISSSGSRHTWKVPGCMYTDLTDPAAPVEKEIPTDAVHERELAMMIAASPQAKEVIRTAFEIPGLPEAKEVEELEKVRLSKRKKNKKKLSDDEDDGKLKITRE